MNPTLIDQTARDQALDISQSFIVQAPAGSGKTGLLTLRYLRLLSVSEQPEQVLAITFTKKAASEMRNRIMQTLFWARELDQDKETISSHFDTQRLQIANEVLSKDKECSWNLLENPSRLRVQTIDSFCFYLAKQLPVMSRIGGNPTITENTDQCFRHSIANTLRHLDDGHKISSDLEKIQIHLDNDVNRLERLLKNLLLKRDQWLPYILDIDANNEDAKAYLQTCLEELIKESIEEVKAALHEFKSRVIELANFSLTNLKEDEPTRFTQFKNLSSIPSSEPKDRESWSLIINLLLTKDGTWRKTVNKLNGFPTGDGSKKDQQALYKLRKKQFLELKDELICNDALLDSLNYLRLLPNPSTSQQQWDFITSLTNILAQLSSELLLSFRHFMLIDYTEASAAARTALGSDTNPTDLALALDHNIRHILVDEFQDTSQSQLDMLLQLTNGWEIHDERTLFLVGDAMQSCYGFRNANVGIYLNVQQNGLPNIVINNLQLSANFRSEPGIVDWINNHFETAFPIKPNPSKGAVPYSPSTAVKPSGMLQAVDTEIITYSSDRRLAAKAAEAKQVIAHINKLREETNAKTTESIAILVRSRNHLMQIAKELHSSNIAWESTDIDRIGAMQIIEDLLSLTKALLNPHDRLSWFATLRAPWLGLVLSDLNTIAKHSQLESVWEVILNWQNIQGLSSDGKSRLEQFVKCMSYGMEFRYQLSLREIVESTWILLRGAAVIGTKREIACVSFYLELLDTYEQAGGIRNLDEFQEKVLNSFIPVQVECPQSDNEVPVQLLTIHKAKGLEFDHVIIPGLANRPRSDEKPLINWHERLNNNGRSRFFIAALSATGSDDDGLYSLLRYEKQNKALLESTRLLYIAITRAKRSAKLLATVPLSTKGELQISSSSLMGRLWRELKREASGLNIVSLESLLTLEENSAERSNDLPSPTLIRRLKNIQVLNDTEFNILTNLSQNRLADKKPESEPESKLSSHIGRIIHQELEEYVDSEDKTSFMDFFKKRKNYWSFQLRNSTNSMQEVNESLRYIEQSIQKTIESETLKWIFDKNQSQSQTELSITSINKGKIETHIIDRTFVDSNNVRWIIDYKSNLPKTNDKASFIAAQIAQHQGQLQHYRNLFERMENREIRTALVLTTIPKLVEV